jgi:hypothetical protein
LLVFAACTINHRSGEFACDNNADCQGGRVCQQNLCVEPGTGPDPDGGMPDPDGPEPFVCPTQCTSCVESTMTCNVNCEQPAAMAVCQQTINCPEGFHCVVKCPRSSASANNGQCPQVNCQNALSCDISCTGNNTCKQVTCGEGPCEVLCDGLGSCGQVQCDDSCACDVSCTLGRASCQTLDCPGSAGQCNTLGQLGCNSNRPNCNTCDGN